MFAVYESFLAYKGGVYYDNGGRLLGHTTTISLGWGI